MFVCAEDLPMVLSDSKFDRVRVLTPEEYGKQDCEYDECYIWADYEIEKEPDAETEMKK